MTTPMRTRRDCLRGPLLRRRLRRVSNRKRSRQRNHEALAKPVGAYTEDMLAQPGSLFYPVVEPARLDPRFRQIAESRISQATRRVMDETFRLIPSRDAN